MTNRYIIDPIIGEELVQIILDPYTVTLRFSCCTLVIKSLFLLKRNKKIEEEFAPDHKGGDLSKLWALLGSKIAGVIWNELIRINLDNDCSIEIPATPGHPRGTFYGGTIIEGGADKRMVCDDF
jgi:hypothetical protein